MSLDLKTQTPHSPHHYTPHPHPPPTPHTIHATAHTPTYTRRRTSPCPRTHTHLRTHTSRHTLCPDRSQGVCLPVGSAATTEGNHEGAPAQTRKYKSPLVTEGPQLTLLTRRLCIFFASIPLGLPCVTMCSMMHGCTSVVLSSLKYVFRLGGARVYIPV